MEQTRDQILEEARKILKTNEIDINKKGWAIFWCPNPAHNDAARAGTTGAPNFGVDLSTGRYNCFRCGFKGGSLYSLAKKLGSDYKPAQVGEWIPKKKKRELNGGVGVADLAEAIADAQSRILSSSAMSYLKHRGVTPYTAMMYGLGYGIGNPAVSYATSDAAYKLSLVYKREWLWSESVIYADPVTDPAVLNVRYLPPEYMRHGRGFELKKPHRTWGDRLAPLGAWRITERTQAIMAVEGLFDMLVGAQFLDQRGLYPDIACVYTNGASPSAEIVEWFAQHDYDYFLIQDPDKAGDTWTETLTGIMNEKGYKYTLIYPPDDKDPDEAFLSGWWPPCI
jgi:hypothetical protein